MRRILYLTGTRADFGLMHSTLQRIHAHIELDLGIIVTGMHLDSHYGNTLREIERSGLPIIAKVPVQLRSDKGSTMARAIAAELLGVTKTLERYNPDFLMLLGDRGEMLAGAIAALHLNIPIVHLHGGERSGTVDEPIRHAISKLAHYHFTATKQARERLIRMGESPSSIFVTGAPGLDDLNNIIAPSRDKLLSDAGLDPNRHVALVVFHPVVQQSEIAGMQMKSLLTGIEGVHGLQSLVLMPNADAGGEAIREILSGAKEQVLVVDHLPREHFCHWLARCDVMIGNSSSGIIEAASFGTPVVNVGDRQKGRERSNNLVDVPVQSEAIKTALKKALKQGRLPKSNVYGDGNAGERITDLMSRLPVTPELLLKCNAY